ncbi:MAG: membrane protein insertase YidC [Bacteroidales bacterium]
MSFIDYLLAPFIFLIREIFLFNYHLTGDYGISIVLLSLAVSLLLLPIFILIERSKKKDDAVKRKMRPLLEEIRRSYKGQERYYYIRTLHRQHGYNSFKSLVPVLSLLLQIPFFIAAYQFLEHFETLAGQSFLFIDDLSAPDRLLGSINVLPIIMTLVNLVTAYFYTRNGDKAERKQMLVVAGLFLVLLYNFPSGLVLYWTMNNVFSFFRLFVTNPEVFKRTKGLKGVKRLEDLRGIERGRAFEGAEEVGEFGEVERERKAEDAGGGALFGLKKRFIAILPKLYRTFFLVLVAIMLLQLNWAFNHNFDDIGLRIILSALSSLLTIILLAALVITHWVHLPEQPLKPKEFLFHLLPVFKPMLIVITSIAVLFQLNWALEYNFNDFALRVILSVFSGAIATLLLAVVALFYQDQISFNPGKLRTRIVSSANDNRIVFRSMLFLTIYFYFGSKYYFGGVNDDLALIAIVTMVIGQITGLRYFAKSYKNISRRWSWIAVAALTVILLFQCLNIWALTTGSGSFAVSILNLNISLVKGTLLDIVLPGILFISIIALVLTGRSGKKLSAEFRSDGPVYLLSILYLLGFILLWNPIEVYSSYPSNFDFTAFDILKNNFTCFAAAFIILTTLYYVLPRKARHILFIISTSAVVLGFIHNTIAPIKMGTLQDAVFLKHDNLARPLPAYLLEGLGILAIIYAVKWFFQRNYHKQLRYVLVVLNVVLITQSLVAAGNTGSFFHKQNIPSDPSSSISFSKDSENIVLVVLDMFHGWYVNKAIEEVPELKRVYEGFVWYPNTLAVSNITGSTIGSMLGGYQYTIDRLNQDITHTLQQKINHIASEFNAKIRARGFRFSGNRIIYSDVDSLTYDTFIPKWHENWDMYNSKLNIGVTREVGYSLLRSNAAFYSAPLILKPGIYNEGQWLQGNVNTNENTSRSMQYNFLRLLPYISDSKNSQPNFIYLYSQATHHPWDIVDQEGELQTDVTPYENNKWTLKTLSIWIEWMKKHDVYDNTKIIIVSDHGPHWWFYKGEVDTNIPVVSNTQVKRINEQSMGLFALMLVKDFNKRGALKEDWRLMSNADVSAIIFDENDPTKATPPLSRTLPTSVVLWERKLWELSQLRILHQFEVTDNMYDLNNWKVVE